MIIRADVMTARPINVVRRDLYVMKTNFLQSEMIFGSVSSESELRLHHTFEQGLRPNSNGSVKLLETVLTTSKGWLGPLPNPQKQSKAVVGNLH